MAIVDMDRISLVGLQTQKHQILKLLMKRECIQIDDSSNLAEDESLKGILKKDGDELAVSMYEQKIIATSNAITALESAIKRKKFLFALPLQSEKLKPVQVEELYSFVGEVNLLGRQIIELKANENSLKNKMDSMAPWVDFDIPLETSGTRFTRLLLGSMPANLDFNTIEIKLAEIAPESIIGIVDKDKSNAYIYLIAHKEIYEKAVDILKEFSLSPVSFSDIDGTPSQVIKNCGHLIAKSENERADIDSEILKRAEKLPELERLYDHFNMEKEQASILSNLVKTETTFSFNGWVPSDKSAKIEKEITEKFDCCVYIKPGDKKEGIPILLNNNAFVEPFESITSMYSLPHSSNIDPNTMVAIFYFIFYGMMLSDAGYGIIMTAACGFIALKYKPAGNMGKMIRMLALCGISTTVWGFVFGSIFGGLIPMKGLLDPLVDVMAIMGVSILFGIIHIYIGLGMKAYMLIRDGKPLAAIWDVVSWYLFVTGLVILIAPTVMGDINPTVLASGKYMAIAGAALLILTQGRDQKNLLGKAFGGVKSLYGITGYFGDILSYLRLMALCLSTGVIATVINLLGEMTGPIGAIFIGLIGHTINLLINALGAYVHTSRLQYVEFFGKFFEGGGKAFNPFKLKSKYVIFKEEK